VYIPHILLYKNLHYVYVTSMVFMAKVVILHIIVRAKVMSTYRTKLLRQKSLCVHTAHNCYGKSYVHILHKTVMAKVVMCTYCTKLLRQKLLCVHAVHTLYGKSYEHILHEFVIAKVTRTYYTYYLWKKSCT
jgi:hypothetical protein